MSQEYEFMEYPKRLLIIPARGGSKRIPGKNMIDVCGSPIIKYPIETALESKLFQEILISSDDNEILDYVKKYENISTSKRPKELAGDHSTIFSTLKHEYLQKKNLGISYDEIWLLSATACLVSKEDLLGLSATYQQLAMPEAILAVTEFEVPVQWAMSIGDTGKLKSFNFDSFGLRSQDLEKTYHDAGCLAVFSPDVFENYDQGIPEGIFYPYILNRNRSVDIDNFEDIELVRAFMTIKNKSL